MHMYSVHVYEWDEYPQFDHKLHEQPLLADIYHHTSLFDFHIMNYQVNNNLLFELIV